MLERVKDWESYLSVEEETHQIHQHIQQHSQTGRPLGDPGFVAKLGPLIGKVLAPKRPGRKAAVYDEK